MLGALFAVALVVAVLGLAPSEASPTAAPPIATPRLRAGPVAKARAAAPASTAEEDQAADDPAPTLQTSDLPEELGRRDLEAGMDKVRHAVESCRSLEQFMGLATVEVVIAKTGLVQSATMVPPLDKTRTGDCVARAVRTAVFPRFRGFLFPTLALTYPFYFKPE
jgi:hypothetical protein